MDRLVAAAVTLALLGLALTFADEWVDHDLDHIGLAFGNLAVVVAVISLHRRD